jgi:hypothetical protein
MSVATLNIKVSPRRMLSARGAAEYCGIGIKGFGNECAIAPVQMPNGTKLYDMRDLDIWLDGLKNDAPHSDSAILRKLG